MKNKTVPLVDDRCFENEWLEHSELIYELNERMATAAARYGAFASTHEALGVASEEWDELREAIHKNKFDKIEQECLDLAAVLIRLADGLRNDSALRRRSKK